MQSQHHYGKSNPRVHFILLAARRLDNILQLVTDSTIESFSYTHDKALQTMGGLFNGVNQNVKKMSNGYASIDSMMIIYFIFQGIRSFPVNPAFASSLFYWAYTVLKNSEEKGGD